MNHVAMNPHLSETCRHGYRLVGNHPHFCSPAISFHREPNRSAIDRADPNLFQCRNNSEGHFVSFVCRVMEFEVGDGTGWRPDVLPVHAADNTDERSGPGKDVLNVSLLIGNFWPITLNKTHIVCSRIQTQLPEPSCIKYLLGSGFNRVRPFLVELFHSWVFRQLRHECSPLSQLGRLAKASTTTGSRH